jgi:hypothetical protein
MSDAAMRAMVRAARALSRDGLADLIETGMDARRVLALLRLSVHPEIAAHAAVILTAAGYAEPRTWASSGLRAAVIHLCDDDDAKFEACKARAESAL